MWGSCNDVSLTTNVWSISSFRLITLLRNYIHSNVYLHLRTRSIADDISTFFCTVKQICSWLLLLIVKYWCCLQWWHGLYRHLHHHPCHGERLKTEYVVDFITPSQRTQPHTQNRPSMLMSCSSGHVQIIVVSPSRPHTELHAYRYNRLIKRNPHEKKWNRARKLIF